MADVKVFPPMSEREIKGAEICRRAAAEGMVLLKNEGNTLPLAAGQTLALFGNGAARTVRGGTGSGDPFNGGLSGGGDANINLSPRYHINILDAMEEEYTIRPANCCADTPWNMTVPAMPRRTMSCRSLPSRNRS